MSEDGWIMSNEEALILNMASVVNDVITMVEEVLIGVNTLCVTLVKKGVLTLDEAEAAMEGMRNEAMRVIKEREGS